MGRPMRTFVALRCGRVVRERLHREARALGMIEPDLRIPAAEDLHTTVQFLGQTGDDEVHRIARALEGALADVPPIDVRYVGLGAFPTPERARVLWAGIREEAPGDGLERLVAAVGEALAPLGFPPEARRFHAHVTLARVRRRPQASLVERVIAARELDLGAERLSEVKLILSDPGHRPYHYIDLTTVDLGGA